jgi:predicted RNA-binding Zn-ribbon protein involved in translation (DUF1610 family)
MQKKFYDNTIACPNCESTVITLHNRCPRCKSHNIEKTNLTEHIPCGFIDQRDNYLNDHCPKCGELLVVGQFRNMGQWYLCHDCTERFENPEYDIVCRACSKWFTTKEAGILNVAKFSLNPQRKKEIRQNVASIENIRKVLVDLGFNVEMPGIAMGQKSKMQHNFSLIASKLIDGQEKVVALDLSVSETEVNASPLILLIYKTSEVKIDIPVFVAIPQLNATARQIAQGHDILLIEGFAEEKDLIEKFKTRIQQNGLQKTNDLEFLATTEIPKAEEHKENTSLFSKFRGFKKT